MRIEQTWLKVLVLGSALSAACGADGGAPAANPGSGGNNQGNGAGPSGEGGVTDPGSAGEGGAFPDDKTGPTIVFKQPSTAGGKISIVGGTVQVIATIKDEGSGVATTTVSASIKKSATEVIRLEPTVKMDDFAFTFTASDYEDRADLNLTVQAKDQAGNETSAPLLMQLDTKAPWVSLDPPDLRFYSLVKNDNVCSGNFDPLGAAVQDSQVVEKEARFRAFVWDRAIAIAGQEEFYYAGVNEGKVELLVQDDPKLPLLTDGPDKDKICDTVNEEGAALVRLNPVKSAGTPPSGTGTDGIPPAFADVCASLTKPPTAVIKKLCNDTSDLQYVPTHDVPGGASVVFAVAPTASLDGCTGTTWDSLTKPGWNCVVVRAWDKAAPNGMGNLGFSKPIRVCRKLTVSDCKGDPPATLTCTDGCTLPKTVTAWGHEPFVTKR